MHGRLRGVGPMFTVSALETGGAPAAAAAVAVVLCLAFLTGGVLGPITFTVDGG